MQRSVHLRRSYRKQTPPCAFFQTSRGAGFKAVYRFFDNSKVGADGVRRPHIGQALSDKRQVPRVLGVQGTTEDLGYGFGGKERGFPMHSLLTLTPVGCTGHEDLDAPARSLERNT